MILVTQAVMASSWGLALARFAPVWATRRGDLALGAMVATRPMSSGGLVAAKFGMAVGSVVLSAAVTLVAAALPVLAGGAGEWAELWRDLQGRYPGWRVGAVVALGAVCGLALLWRHLTEVVPYVLTGRAWIVSAAGYAMAAVIAVCTAAGLWLSFHPEDRTRVLAALPWLVAIGAIPKVLVTSWAFRAAIRRGLIGARALFGIMALWLALVASAVALAALTLPAWLPSETRVAALLGIAALVPLARFALAPLALDWNRHG